ncbi:MAG: hypothetical protein M3457_13720 [Chloroflexota bacterium]|nr:hypothetical protein [Chloroflexota bacterium]
MRRLLIPLSVMVVVLLGIVAARPSIGSVAQEATAAHPVIGAWVGDVDANDPANPPTLLLFHDDGTFLQADPDGSNGVGAWEETGPNTASLTAIFHGLDETGAFGGSVMVRAAVVVDASGNTLTAEYTLDFAGADGMSSGEMGPGMATAERIVVEEMGTPVAPMEFDEASTPTAG